MTNLLIYLAGAGCVVTLGVLAFGIGGFGSGKITPRGQNKLMRMRIIAQFVTIVIVLLAVLATRGD